MTIAAANTFLDCTGKDIVISGSGRITGNGVLSLKARNLTLTSGRKIQINESTTARVGIEIDLSGALTSLGQFIAPNAGGRSHIRVQTAGNISVSGGLVPTFDANGTEIGCDGGDVMLVSGGTIDLWGKIYSYGLNLANEDNVNAGGSVTMSALGDVYMRSMIDLHGRDYDGGSLEVVAGGSIALDYQAGTNLPKGEIDVQGISEYGYGGHIFFSAGNSVTVSGPILGGSGINVTGGYGAAADIAIEAGCGGVVIDDSIDLRGGEDGGGYLGVQSKGPVTVSGTIEANSRKYGGDGGSVILASGKTVSISKLAIINVDGHDTTSSGINGEGGLVVLQGCEVDLADDASVGATVTARGSRGGELLLQASRTSLGTSATSMRVGDRCVLDAIGTRTHGSVKLEVSQQRLGTCSNNRTKTCLTFQQCGIGTTCDTPTPNPSTQNFLGQFRPSVTIAQKTGLPACTTLCN